MLHDVTSLAFWQPFLINTARVVAIAILFELLVLAANHWVGRLMAAAMSVDVRREHAWRAKRRERLRRSARGLVRLLLYAVGICVVLEVFQAQTLPLYVVLGAAALIGSIACSGLLRDAVAGYALLLEDALAPGDKVTVEDVSGTVESLGWRSVQLRLASGETHLVCNHAIRRLTTESVAQRQESAEKAGRAGTGQ